MQAPSGPKEDTSGAFKYGGWIAPYRDEFTGQIVRTQMKGPFELLLGRKNLRQFFFLLAPTRVWLARG